MNIDFIAHAFAGCGTEETPWCAGFPGAVEAAPHPVWFGAPAIPVPSFIRDNHNNYVCISTFKRAEDGRFHRRLDSWNGLWLVLLDDIGNKIDESRILLPPSLVVETSPGNHQAWYLLASPERNRERAEALVTGIIGAGASDPGAGSLTRYGRMPRGINGKAKYQKHGKPFVQRVREWEPSRRYSMNELAAAYSIDLNTPKRQRTKRTAPAKGTAAASYVEILDAAGLYLEPIRGMSGGHRIICPWHNQHTSKDTTGTAYWIPSEANDLLQV